MPTYENLHFGVRLDFPDTWKLVSWKHSKLGRSSRSAFQTSDGDLPSKGPYASKFLFIARLFSPGSEALVDADIEVSVSRLPAGQEMRQILLDNLERERAYYHSNGIATSIAKDGTWTIGGTDFGYVDAESISRSGKNRYRFFFRRVEGLYWLSGKIAGHDERKYAEAIRIVEAMECNMEPDA